jgi:hypothetical protein
MLSGGTGGGRPGSGGTGGGGTPPISAFDVRWDFRTESELAAVWVERGVAAWEPDSGTTESPGAVHISLAESSADGIVHLSLPGLGDARGGVLKLRALGSLDVPIKPFAKSSAPGSWADAGSVNLFGEYAVVSLDLEAVSFQQNYDPQQLISVGFQMWAGADVWIDAVWFERKDP